jgi:carboxymethylenebutenolidase
MLIRRRTMLKGVASMPLAAVLADQTITRAVAATTTAIETKTAGGRTVKAALALPAAQKAPAIVLIPEWWGLNDQIRAVAAEFAKLGYVAVAVDLYDGQSTNDPKKAGAMRTEFMKKEGGAHLKTTCVTWANWAKKHNRSNGKLGTIGWCFGGGFSLLTATAAPVDAAVVYYGKVDWPAAVLKGLQGPVLGHFATKDGWINKAMVDRFEANLKAAGKSGLLTKHWYDAQHAFANPTISRFDKEDAQLAWKRTLDFYKKHIG